MRIYNGDCLKIMPLLPAKSVDLIVIDPPYNIKKASWDCWKKQEDYINWLGTAFLECQRLLKDNGSFYFFHNDFPTMAKLQMWIEQNTRFIYKKLITWDKMCDSKKNGWFTQHLSIEMSRNYKDFNEFILFYTFQDETGWETIKENHWFEMSPYAKILKEYLDKGFTQKQISLLELSKNGKPTGWVTNKLKFGQLPTPEQWSNICKLFNIDNEYESLRQEYESLRYTFNVQNVKESLRSNACVWQYPNACTKNHITAKPVELIENIIKHSSNVGDTILDCFAGSFTTGVACQNLGRHFIGIEIDKSYYEKGKERMAMNRKLFDLTDC